MIGKLFKNSVKRFLSDRRFPEHDLTLFRRPAMGGQMEIF
jgi:hypothetical protein